MRTSLLAAPLAALASALLGSPSLANELPRPASLLVFPEFDNGTGRTSLLTVTNTDLTPAGAVKIVVVFVNGQAGAQPACSYVEHPRVLTPGDTLTLWSAQLAPDFHRGFAYAYAVSAATQAPIKFDRLIGSTMVLDAGACGTYALNAIPFAAGPELAHGQLTDVDGDGIRDLNGIEYAPCPDRIVVPRFLGYTPSNASTLVLVNLTGGGDFEARVLLMIYNDNEDPMSDEFAFTCWVKAPLPTVSSWLLNEVLLTNPNDPTESVGGLEQGWFTIDGIFANSVTTTITDPAVLAVLVEPLRSAAAELPFGIGQQTNGDLLPSGPFGDVVGN